MDIEKANVRLLLEKVRAYLDSVPAERRKGKRFVEAEKALARLEKLFADKEVKTQLVGCGREHPEM